jgi:hypothetical protein
MADYSDWELHSTLASDLQAAANFFGFTQGDGFTASGIRYTIYLYGTKYVRSTTQTFVDAYGGTQFAMVAQPGVYGILRWYSTTPFPPAGVNLPPRVTIIPLPADSPVRFA